MINNTEQKRLVCLMPVDLLQTVDEYAAQLHVNRTAAVNILISRALQYETMFKAFPRMMELYDSIEKSSENGKKGPQAL